MSLGRISRELSRPETVDNRKQRAIITTQRLFMNEKLKEESFVKISCGSFMVFRVCKSRKDFYSIGSSR